MAWLRNPIVSREFLTSLRNPRGFLMLLVTIGLPAALVLSAWPSGSVGAAGQGTLARQLFEFFVTSQLVLVALLVPATLAPSLTLEKEKDTIDLLHTTPLGGDAIVLGKLLSGVGFLLLLCSSAVPLLSMIALFGGVRLDATLQLYAAVVIHALVYGVTSILISALARRTAAAIVLAYVAVAVEAFVLVPAADDLLDTAIRAGILLGVTYPLARWAARRPYNPVPKPPEEPDPYRDTGLVLRHDAFPDKFLLPPPRDDVLPDDVNPVVVKELASGIHGAGSRFVRALIWIGAGLGLFAFFATIAQDLSPEGNANGTGYLFFCFVATFAALLGPAIGARAFSGERDEGTNEMLVLTVIPRWRLVSGKFLAYLRVVLTLSAINTIPFLPYAFVRTSPLRLLLLVAVLLSCTTTAIAVGLFFSLEAKSTVTAMLRSFVALFTTWAGPVFLGPLLGKVGIAGDLALRLLSPYFAFAVSTRSPDLDYQIAAAVLHVILWGALVGLILRHCVKRFDAAMNVAAER
jgi:ABC-type transport system involved in multi-copper enzyme maturation permease subunit